VPESVAVDSARPISAPSPPHSRATTGAMRLKCSGECGIRVQMRLLDHASRTARALLKASPGFQDFSDSGHYKMEAVCGLQCGVEVVVLKVCRVSPPAANISALAFFLFF
jgi:hypothetical protein